MQGILRVAVVKGASIFSKYFRASARWLALALVVATPCAALAQAESSEESESGEMETQPEAESSSSLQVSFLDAPSPEKIAITPGGVDIRTGRLSYTRTDLSIGEGAGEIELQRIMTTPIAMHAAPFGNLSHNWDILLTIKHQKIEGMGYDYVANVHFGGRSQTFEKLYIGDNVFRQKSQNDYTSLTTPGVIGANGIVYTYRATDGTIAVFRPIVEGECISAPNDRQCAFVSYIVEPDGTRFDFEYETTTASVANKTRLRSVTSSRGYALLFEYGANGASWNQVSKACVLNLASVAKPSDNICSGTALSTATYSYTGLDSRVVIASATAPGSMAENFGYVSTVPSQEFTMSFTKPGAGAPWMTNELAYGFADPSDGISEPYVEEQDFADGSGYTYNYDLTPFTDDGMGQNTSYQTIAGGTYSNALGQMTEVRYDFPPTPGSRNPPRVPGMNGSYGGYLYVNFGDIVFQITGGPARIVDPLGRETLSNYCDPNAMANLPPQEYNRCLITMKQSQTDPDGGKVFLKYGVNNHPIEIRRVAKPGSGLADIVETAAYSGTACTNLYPSCDKPITVTDAKGIVTDYTWSSTHGGMLTETRAAPTTGAVRPQKRYSYQQFYAWYKNAAGTLVQSPYATWLPTEISECRTGAAPACVGTADETRTTFTYGPTGSANNLLPVSKTVAAGDASLSATTSWTYDALGNKLTEDGPLAGTDDTTRWRYDAQRRVIGVVAPDPDGAGIDYKYRATRNSYDAAGRLTKVEQGTVDSQSDVHWAAFAPLITTETAYDALDRKTRMWVYGATGGTQTLTQYSYDLAGRLECTAVRMNPAAFATPPTSACTLGTQGTGAGDFGPDRITRLVYNAAGEVTKTVLAYGTPLQTDQETNSYTPNGKLATVTDGENNRTTFEYDGHDRLSKTRYPVTTVGALASSTTDYEQLSYDANGNVTQRRLRDGQLINYSFDNLNRMTAKDVPNLVAGEYDVTTTYDNLDRPTLVADTAGGSVGSTFDALGRMTAQTSPFGTIGLQYDAAGRLTRVTHPDGQYFGYTYNISDLTGINENGGASLVAYGYDDLGLRKSIIRGNGTVKGYQYTEIGRLRRLREDLAGTSHDIYIQGTGQPNGHSIVYNPAGQIVSQIRTNDLYAWNGHFNVDRSYARNGLNQLTSAGATALGYDGRGNLTSSGSDAYSYTSENRLATGPGGTSLWYDPTGRISKLTKGAVTKKYEHLGPRLVIERDAAGAITNRYVHGPGDDEPVVWYIGSGLTTKRWLHSDERGSVIAVSDAAGLATAVNRYDEYGIPAATNVGTFQYTGQAWVPELGLYHYKARMYSPTLGRFMQTDPIGYEDGINWYAYVANDPVNRTDFDGQQSDEVMDRRNQAFVTAMKECNGGCLQTYADAADLATSIPSPASLTKTIVVQGVKRVGLFKRLGRIVKGLFGGGRSQSRCCFVAGTLVDTENGLQPIENIKVGDKVWARDAETGETALKEVTNLIQRHERVIWEVAFAGPSGKFESFKTTNDHPWWVAGHGWKRTEELVVGMAVVTRDRRGMVLTAASETGRTDTTYNLTVADFETYFVGEQRLLVHNCPTGSYTNTHASGTRYHGKGDASRAADSGRREASRHNDPHVSTEARSAPNDRESFKQESRALEADGGSKSNANYNRIDSPGTKYRREDGEID